MTVGVGEGEGMGVGVGLEGGVGWGGVRQTREHSSGKCDPGEDVIKEQGGNTGLIRTQGIERSIGTNHNLGF